MRKFFITIIINCFALLIFAQDPGWTVNPSDYQFSANLTGVISQNGVFINSTGNKLGAFVNGQLRGVATSTNVIGQQMFFLTIYSNVSSGETVSFKTYIANEDSIYNIKDSIAYVKNSVYGSPQTPIELKIPNNQTDFLTFSFSQQISPASINAVNHTVNIELVNGSSLSNLIANFTLSEGAICAINSVEQASGIDANDFTNPVIYVVTAEDGISIENWTVNVSISTLLSNEANLLSFSFAEQTGLAIIDNGTQSVTVEVSNGTILSNLVASFTLSAGATATVNSAQQQSGITANDFSSPVTYTVLAQDLSTSKNWTVNVTVESLVSNETNILTFSITEQALPATIDNNAHVVTVETVNAINLSSLTPTFTLSSGAMATVNEISQLSGVTSNNFTYPLIYKVLAEDGNTSQNWIVHIYDPILITDTTFVTINDTVTFNVTDTTFVTINDTVTFSVTDTTFIISYDTITVTLNDTTFITVYDSISVTDTLIIDVILSVNPLSQNTIKVYPNPASDMIYINSGNFGLMSNYSIKITSLVGQIVFESLLNQSDFVIDVNTFGQTGTYLVYILDDALNIVEQRKIILF
ncbi:MAG: hypothetical protein A2033_18270 [Bacteroidetes bacterium GWA2_31_9]|nr:MAG: hypothetical protein A2033_18270 [Bacteroidetes bacterium GWA2_31_9]